MKIYLGSDHAGFHLKENIKAFLDIQKIPYEDLTPVKTDGDDYPDAAKKVAEKVAETGEKGILMCGTGIGVNISANKVKGIRAAHPTNVDEAELATRHNHVNILCMGGRTTDPENAKNMVSAWLNAKEEKGRHSERIKKIDDMEK